METIRIQEVDVRLRDQLRDFEVNALTPIDELRVETIELAHQHGGARLRRLCTEDTENLFCINLPTPPSDDTGVPHILERTVSAGSHQFPVKKPSFEMAKRSMTSFINAIFW